MWNNRNGLRRIGRSAGLDRGHSAMTLRSIDTTATIRSRTVTIATVLTRNCCSCRNDVSTAKGQKRQLLRLLLLYLLPVCIYLIFSSNELTQSIRRYQTYVDTVRRASQGLESVKIIQYLQTERSVTVKYLSSNISSTDQNLRYVYNATDTAILVLVSTQHDTLTELLDTKLKNVRHQIEVNSSFITTFEAAELYSKIIDFYMDTVITEILLKIPNNMWASVVSYELYTELQERVREETDYGCSYFAARNLNQVDKHLLYMEKAFKSDEALETFKDFIPLMQLNFSVLESLENIDKLGREVASLDDTLSVPVTFYYWFDNITVIINRLSQLHNSFGSTIINKVSLEREETEFHIILIGSLLCFIVLLTPLIIRVVYTTVKKLHHFLTRLNEKSRELNREKRRSDRLLNTMLPKAVTEELKRTGFVQAETFDQCTIYFSDIVGFTTICSRLSPMEVVAMLNGLYSLFDSRIGIYDCYKVETIGDAYMVVSGIPVRNGIKHVGEIASLALDLQTQISLLSVPHRPTEKMKMRIGIHSGNCVAGVVGTSMPRYCLFGVTVNIAARMESYGQAGRIHISESTYDKLKEFGGYETKERGTIRIKDTGEMKTYWLLGKTSLLMAKSSSRLTVAFPS
ncbi:uncharacterized protein [Ptychodera flava]|uniref:uncharacterized protein n=1 Tax=Ptychodera flava TaxID=63121 RepID=UPI00396A5454